MNALRLRGICAGYAREVDVLKAINLEVAAGETVAIMGPSGCGKSTLLKLIAGLVEPRAGHMEVLGKSSARALPRGAIGYVPQRLGLVRHTSVLDNVVHGGLHETSWWQSLTHRAPSGVVRRSWKAIDAVGLGALAHRPIHRLSGGQQRRVAIARTMVQRPRIMLADEFLGEMDPVTVKAVVDAVRLLQEENDLTAIFVEHALDKAKRFADRVLRFTDNGVEEA